MTYISPRKALNPAFRKIKPQRSQIEKFKSEMIRMLDDSDTSESEEFHKNLLGDFLKRTYYDPTHFINTDKRKDLVIHTGNSKSDIGVIIETKKETNSAEMITRDRLNAKAMQELLLYYLRERILSKNLNLKHLIITNFHEWFIFDAQEFEKHFGSNKSLANTFRAFEEERLSGKSTDFFYKEIAKPLIAKVEKELQYTYFNLDDYDKVIRNKEKADDSKLVVLYKLLSPEHILKQPFANDSNSLDKKFYAELLHIIGLSEVKIKGKKVIERPKAEERNSGSLLENAIIQIDSLYKLSRIKNESQYGSTKEEKEFNVGLELVITWINRILFLKLLEAQLISYNKKDQSYSFLNYERLNDFDEINKLFFQVLAKTKSDRRPEIEAVFSKVPYLNSSLFDPTELEHDAIAISNLVNDKTIPIHPGTVLRDANGKKLKGDLNTLEYLLSFLNAYDFSSQGGESIQEENKSLINASVLGLIFEKINGYKDGSFFTPGFVTMYMCRETIRRAVVQKFNDTKGWSCKTLDDLYDKIEDRIEANEIINDLKICDPAVGSGHFLVSALNEVIAIKHDLKILLDRNGRRLKEYDLAVVNDELVITDEEHQLLDYNPKNKESQRIQETLFHEKQTIIENCLFGVDINPNSVKICRLRLWIELLKHAYYRPDGELETLPNIDINIKCGDSLIRRFGLDADIKQALKTSGKSIKDYQLYVQSYRQAKSKDEKRELMSLIDEMKSSFRTVINTQDPIIKKLARARGELFNLTDAPDLFGASEVKTEKWKKKVAKVSASVTKLEKEIEEIKHNKIFNNAFEWRFEFPEVLSDDGDYVGFDSVIGNPPYFSLSKSKEYQAYFEKSSYQTYSKGVDIYCLFYELGGKVLNSNGLLSYITSNSWIRAKYGNALKKYFVDELPPISLLNIEDVQIFEEATVESNILIAQKGVSVKEISVCNLAGDYSFGDDLMQYFKSNQFFFLMPTTDDWFIDRKEVIDLRHKIELDSKILKDFNVSINFGIKTGYNEAFIIDSAKRKELLDSDSSNADLIKPILRGKNLSRFTHSFSGEYLINSHNGIKASGVEPVNVEYEYPDIYQHLSSFLPNIKERYDQGKHWTNLRNCAYILDMTKPKVIWGEISDRPKFSYDDGGYFAEATTFIMIGEKLKFLLAILNSNISEWYFNLIGTTTGMGTNRWKKYKIELLPIKEPSESEEQLIEKLVDEIIQKKKADPNNDTIKIEKELNRIIYDLYDLSPQEIEFIESSLSK